MNRLRQAISVAAAVCAGIACSAYAASPVLKEIETAFIDIGTKVRPCVVNVDAQRNAPEGMRDFDANELEEFFRFFGRPMPQPEKGQKGPKRQMPRPKASGSGFIYDKEGHIITNNHVVADAESIKVRLWDGRTFDAEVAGRDPQTDVAIIKIDAGIDLPTATLGDSDALKVGQFAIAAGSPHSLEGSLSFGHISALGRGQADHIDLPDIRFLNLIQTDAAINLGNSGGPLCNIDGEVIGINTAIVWGAESIGFAIPINTAKKVIPALIDKGKVIRGYLGVGIEDASKYADAESLPDTKGAYVTAVVDGTPASRAGIQIYDVVRKINGAVIESAVDLQNKISDLPPGNIPRVEIWRDGKTIELDVQLGEYPENEEEALLGEAVLGIRVRPLTEDMIQALGLEPGAKGVFIASVEPGSPADDAGLRDDDVLLEVAKLPVGSPDEFRRIMKENTVPGKSMLMRVRRAGSDLPIIITVKIPKEGQGE